MNPKKAAHVKTSKPGSKSTKKVRQKPKKTDAVEATAYAFLTAIQKAQEAEMRPSDRVSATLLKLIDATIKYAAPPPPPPFTPLPPQQMPTVWQIAHLAALIGQSDPGKLRSLAHDLPDDPTVAMSASEEDYQTANSLTHAALTLLRSAHDMRQIWQLHPKLQQNYQAGMFSVLVPSHDEQEERQSRVQFVLANLLSPKTSDKSRFDENAERYWMTKDAKGQTTVDKDRFAEHWIDADFVTWNDAAILFFRDEVTGKGQASPGQATKTQSKNFASCVAAFLEKTSYHQGGEIVDSAHFIELWQRTTYETPADVRPMFLQPGYFFDLWHQLISYFQTSAAERVSAKMKSVRRGEKIGGSANG
jgi:hypothetical protein